MTPAIGTPTKQDVTTKGKKRIRGGALLWPVGVWSLKGDIYASLRKTASPDITPPGYCHFGKFLDKEYFKQLTSEYISTEMFHGRTRRVWKQSRADNHMFDCRVYATAMADKLGLTRKSPDAWERLADTLGVPMNVVVPSEEEDAPSLVVKTLPRRKRAHRRSNFMR